jgi:hypothetical protein
MGRMCSKNWSEEEFVWVIGGKAKPGRPRCRWMDNIKTNLRLGVIVCTGLIWLRIGTNGRPF